jgi:hypothetical protein
LNSGRSCRVARSVSTAMWEKSSNPASADFFRKVSASSGLPVRASRQAMLYRLPGSAGSISSALVRLTLALSNWLDSISSMASAVSRRSLRSLAARVGRVVPKGDGPSATAGLVVGLLLSALSSDPLPEPVPELVPCVVGTGSPTARPMDKMMVATIPDKMAAKFLFTTVERTGFEKVSLAKNPGRAAIRSVPSVSPGLWPGSTPAERGANGRNRSYVCPAHRCSGSALRNASRILATISDGSGPFSTAAMFARALAGFCVPMIAV